MTYLVWLVVVFGSTLLPYVVNAQTEVAAPARLPAVEVRGQYLGAEQRIRDSTTFATVVDVKESTSQIDSIADVLSENVGVQVRRFGGLGAFSTVSIRGSTPSQVDVYLNGVRLNQANFGLVNLGDIPLDNLERVEIYRGFSPLQLGAGGIGGSINLVTRQVAGETVNSVSGSYGSFDTRKFTLYRSQAFSNLGYIVLFNYTGSKGDFDFLDNNGTPFNPSDDEEVKRQNNNFNAFNVDARGEMTLAGWHMTLLNDFFTKDQGVPGRSNNQSKTARLGVWRNVATLRLEKRRFPWALTDTALQLAYAWQRENFKDPENEIGIGVQDQRDNSNAFSINGLTNVYLEDLYQVLGLLWEWRYETYRTINRVSIPNDDVSGQGPLQRRASVTVALQDEILLFDERLAIRPLLRYQFVDSHFGAQPDFRSLLLDTDRDDQDHLFSPSLGVKFRLLSFLDLKGNVGRFARVPTLFELFGDRGTVVGNPQLDPEHSVNWDMGFALELPPYGILDRIFFESAYFASHADDLIVFVQTSQGIAQARNIGSAAIHGCEVSWSMTTFQHVRLFGNYTYQHAEDSSGNFNGNALPGRPRHELHQSFELFATYGKLVYAMDYIGKNFLDRTNFLVVDHRLLHNISLTVLPFGHAVKFTFEAKNLTNNQVEDVYGYPLPGRSFFGTVEGRF